jgi:acyl-coenzyme A thioesterase PaaI-like protein
VTVSLSIDMMGPAKQGEWVEARVEVGRAGRSTTFLSCFVWVGEERIARASGVFQVRALPGPAQ